MKNLFWISIILLFIACNNTENENVSDLTAQDQIETVEDDTVIENDEFVDYNKLLIGVWKNTIFHGDEYIFDDLHTFKEDGSFLFDDGTFNSEGTWKIKEGILIINTIGKDENWGKMVSANETNFTVKHDDGTESIYVKQ